MTITMLDYFLSAGESSIGAVTPPVMSWLIERVVEAMA